MVPTISGLVEAVLETETIRSDFEDALKEAKEKSKETRRCIKNENARWELQKKELETAKEEDVSIYTHIPDALAKRARI
jgi:hypothetical protein